MSNKGAGDSGGKQKIDGFSRRDLLKRSATLSVGIAAGGALLGATAADAQSRKDVLVAIDLTGATWSGGIATLTFAAQSTAPAVGSIISVAGVKPTGYDGLWAVKSSAPDSLTFKLAKNPGGDGTGGSFAIEDLLPASTKITDLGLSSSDSKLLTKKAAKLTKSQLFTLASGTNGMSKLKLSVKDVESISTAFATANARMMGIPIPGCCCNLCCCSCCIVIKSSATEQAIRPAVGCCCSCCCCIRINSPGNSGSVMPSMGEEVMNIIAGQSRSRLIP